MLRRVLFVIAMLNTLAIICSLVLAMLMPAHLVGSLSAVSFAKEVDQQPKCPDVPVQDGPPMLDFCSPKNHGKVAGPYGARITLASENLPVQPDHWAFIKQDNSLQDPAKLVGCIKAKECFVVSADPSSGTEQNKILLYTFTWSGQGFPTAKGDYYIEALNGNLSDVTNLQILSSTPVAYSLLTTEAPCIALSVDQNHSPCTSTVQDFPVQLGQNETKNVIITGKNWLLGKLAKGDEKVHVTAKCLSGQQCNQDTLFDVSCDVDENGTFIPTTVSIPANASGKYRIHATSKLQDNVQPGQSDYQQQPANTNTIANNILTFGDDPNAPFVVNVKFPPPPPSRPPLPLTDETGLFYSALGAAAPAALSIGVFFIVWMRRRNEDIVYQLPSRLKPDLRSALSFAWLPFGTKKAQMSSLTPPPLDFLLTHFLPLHEQLLENAKRPRSTGLLPLGSRNAIPSEDINQALEQWEREGDITQVVKVTEIILSAHISAWRVFHERLIKSSSHQRLSQEKQQQWLIWAEKEYNEALSDSRLRLKYCSEVLAYSTILLSMKPTDAVQTLLHYRMGFTYVLLAIDSDSPLEIIELLAEADRSYSDAYPTIIECYAESQPDFLASIDLAVGDVNTAILQWQPNLDPSKAQEYRGKADSAYQHATLYGSDQAIRTEIQKRIDKKM